MANKNILFFLCFSVSVFFSYSQKIDTAYIKTLVGRNIFFKKDSMERYNFKIISSQSSNLDTLYIKFDLLSTSDWNKKGMPVKAYFKGFILQNKQLILHGNFSYSILNRNDVPVSTIGNYVYDKLEGMSSVRTNNYFISKSFYRNGMKNGIDIGYWSTEKEVVNEISYYVNDTLHGSFCQFYQSGALKEKGNYKMGNKHGEFISYYESGKVKQEKIFSNDILKGKSTEYYENGKIKKVGEYSGNYLNIKIECDTCKPQQFVHRDMQGKIVDVYKIYSIEFKKELGGAMRDWHFKENNIFPLKKGIWLYYNEDGSPLRKIRYDPIGNAFIIP